MLKMQSGCCQRITKPSLTPIHAILFKPPCSSCLTLPLTPHLNYHKPQSIKPTPNPSSSNQYPLPSNQFSSTPYHISNPPVHSTSSPLLPPSTSTYSYTFPPPPNLSHFQPFPLTPLFHINIFLHLFYPPNFLLQPFPHLTLHLHSPPFTRNPSPSFPPATSTYSYTYFLSQTFYANTRPAQHYFALPTLLLHTPTPSPSLPPPTSTYFYTLFLPQTFTLCTHFEMQVFQKN